MPLSFPTTLFITRHLYPFSSPTFSSPCSLSIAPTPRRIIATSTVMDSRFLGTTNATARRAAFAEDEGLASLADKEPGISGKHAFFSTRTRKSSYRDLSRLSSSSRSVLFYEESHHFLDSCYLCRKPIGWNKDIFMYRGNTPFCSVECRQEQIDIDEAAEKNWSLSMKVASRKEPQKSSASSKGKSDNFRVRTGTVVAG